MSCAEGGKKIGQKKAENNDIVPTKKIFELCSKDIWHCQMPGTQIW